MSDVLLWQAEPVDPSGPLIHALVIGVSAYDHLPGGVGPATQEPLLVGLGQLSAAATSAVRVASWLRDRFAYPGAGLGSVRLLASPSPGEWPLPDGATPPPATYDHVRKAVAAWRNDGRRSAENVTLLYVAGHGIQTRLEGGIVLLQDAGAPDSLTPLERAIDVASVRGGMVADPSRDDTATPSIQYYFYDACRIMPSSTAGFANVPAGVVLDEPKGRAADTSFVLWGSRSRDFALADAETKTTLFSKAFTDVLETRAPADTDGRTVRFAHFGMTLETVVGELADEFGEQQQVLTGGSGSLGTPLYLRPAPPVGPGEEAATRELPPLSSWRPVVVRSGEGRYALTVSNERGGVMAEASTYETIDLPPGTYTATIMLPWGGTVSAPFDVPEADGEGAGVAEIAVDVDVPAPSVGRTAASPRLERQLGPTGGAGARWYLRFLTWTPSGLVHLANVTAPAVEVDNVEDDHVAILMHAHGPVLQYAQLRTEDGRSLVVALPIVSMAEFESTCWLHVRVSQDTLGAVVRFTDTTKDAVAGYLVGGRPDQAAAIAPSAEDLLFSKMRDPIGAALGGYALLRLGELDRMHNWADNLGRNFEWLPDGAVIAGELAARQGDDQMAGHWMAQAAIRGLPVLSEGLSLMAGRVPRLVADEDVDRLTARELEARAGPILASASAAEFATLATTVHTDPGEGDMTADRGWRQFVRANMPEDPPCFLEDAMSDVFTLHVLPAGIGDALVLDYGRDGDVHRVLIDGGVTKTTPALIEFLGPDPDLELMMVTHIDNDHIAGMLKVLEATTGRAKFGDVWFNGYRHLPESPLESMGPVEGERLTTYLLEHGIAWNAAFGGRAVMVHPTAMPTAVSLPGGLKLTVLSPGHDQLHELRRKWQPVVEEGGLAPKVPVIEEPLNPPGRLERMGGLDVKTLAASSTQMDHAPANGSSIAVLAEWAGRSALLTGDAHADVLLASLDFWRGPESKLAVDVFKLAHHGSKGNVTNALMQRVTAQVYVFSSSGEGKSQHPNDEAVARTIVHGPTGCELVFNYRTKRTEPWDAVTLKDEFGFRTRYPATAGDPDAASHGGVTIDLMALTPGSS